MSSSQFDAQPANNADQFDKIRELVRSGNKIEAIKIYRGLTGVGLKEAKDAVEALAAGQPVQGPALDRASPALNSSAEPLDEIRRLMQQGNKIEAIKIYRRMTGVGLAEAKMAVEALAAGRPIQVSMLAAASPALGNDSAELMDEVKRLLSQGNKIEAIKIYRGFYDVGLAEAKNAVEQMETELKSSPASASFGAQQTPGFFQAGEPTISPNPFDEPERPSNSSRWLLGCSLAALVGLCVAIPVALIFLNRWPFGQ
jgi:ribosomal protein L7/L12